MTTEQLHDKCLGSLIGGAAGDALGYAVEFNSLAAIKRHYGSGGITAYKLHNGAALISDDTQMILFTANGILNAMQVEGGAATDDAITRQVTQAYKCWMFTQTRPPLSMRSYWITQSDRLWSQRAPGTTCLSAMSQLMSANGDPVINNSKG